jgi:catechol 2,3-dioxygenase
MRSTSQQGARPVIDPATTLGPVRLRVADLDGVAAFYQRAIGLREVARSAGEVHLGAGAGPPLLELVGDPDAPARPARTTGLFHLAILVPGRADLAQAVHRVVGAGWGFSGASDHLVSEALYLDDPEGNGIELYTESPEDGGWSMEDGQYITRRSDGTLSDGREPLDVEALFSHLREDDRLDASIPAATRIGHVHLHVRDLEEAVDFYHGLLGFDVMGLVKPFRMAFVSAGGYHHHIGLNTWQGAGAPPPPVDAAGLRHFTVELPDQKALDEVVARVETAGLPANQTGDGLLVHDPSQNGVVLTARHS